MSIENKFNQPLPASHQKEHNSTEDDSNMHKEEFPTPPAGIYIVSILGLEGGPTGPREMAVSGDHDLGWVAIAAVDAAIYPPDLSFASAGRFGSREPGRKLPDTIGSINILEYIPVTADAPGRIRILVSQEKNESIK